MDGYEEPVESDPLDLTGEKVRCKDRTSGTKTSSSRRNTSAPTREPKTGMIVFQTLEVIGTVGWGRVR